MPKPYKCSSCLTPLNSYEVLLYQNEYHCADCVKLGKEIGYKLEKAFKQEPKEIPIKKVNDGRNYVSDRMLETLKKVAYKQDDYGMDKYKEPLHHSYKYDWLHMALEEEADKLKYIQNEIDRRETIKNMLTLALESNDWYFVEKALETLSLKGTGKENPSK